MEKEKRRVSWMKRLASVDLMAVIIGACVAALAVGFTIKTLRMWFRT